jgi:hypothetical protein
VRFGTRNSLWTGLGLALGGLQLPLLPSRAAVLLGSRASRARVRPNPARQRLITAAMFDHLDFPLNGLARSLPRFIIHVNYRVRMQL